MTARRIDLANPADLAYIEAEWAETERVFAGVEARLAAQGLLDSKGRIIMATTTNKAISSHDPGPEPRKPKVVDQGEEQKAKRETPNRDDAADKKPAAPPLSRDIDPAARRPLDTQPNVSPSDSAANIPVSEAAAGIELPVSQQSAPPNLPDDDDVAKLAENGGDPDSIAATLRRRAEEKRLRAENKDS